MTDSWARLAPTWRTDRSSPLQQGGNDSAKVMVSDVNKIAPFANAQAIHDIGCGNGTVICELIQAYGSELPTSAQLVASDKSESMIAQAKEQQAKFAKEGNKEWSRMIIKTLDAGDMQEIEDATFTHIVGGNMLYAVSDYQKTLFEVKRTLKPGGVFAFTVNADTPWIRLMGLVTTVRPDKVTPYPPAIWQTEESNVEILKSAGFQDVIGKTFNLYIRYDSPEQIIDHLMEVLPWMGRILDGMTEEEIVKSKEIMADHLRREGSVNSMQGKAIIVIGKR